MITFCSKTFHSAVNNRSEHRYRSKFFPSLGVRKVNFNCRNIGSGQGIPNGHASMSISSRIDQKPIKATRRILNGCHNFAFNIALKKLQFDAQGLFNL